MNYQLVIEALPADLAKAQEEISEVLKRECDLHILTLNLDLGQGPMVLASQLSHERATSARQQLEALGVQVLIVQDRAAPIAEPIVQLNEQKCRELLSQTFSDYKARLLASLGTMCEEQLASLGLACLKARSEKRQIFIIGNGGSAANASHLANDLLKHGYNDEKLSFRVVSLTDNTPWLTAIANDYGYDQLFVQQLRNYANSGDLLIAISSSGRSRNILEGVRYARNRGLRTFGVVGFGGGDLAGLVDQVVMIPSTVGDYGVMEDGSIIVGHMLSEFIGRYDKRV